MKNILLIDDDKSICENMEFFVATCVDCFDGKVNFLSAQSLSSGVSIMEAVAIDVLLLDITLGPGGQKETYDFVKGFDHSRLPIMMFTGDKTLATREKFFLAGAVDYFPKDLCKRDAQCLMDRAWNLSIKHRQKYAPT